MLNIIIMGCFVTLLPKYIISFCYSFLGNIIRVFGSICVIICLCDLCVYCTYINTSIEFFASMYLSFLILLSLVKIVYGFYILYNTYNISIYSVYIYVIVLIRIVVIFILNILGFSILEGFIEILLYVYDIKGDLYTFYKRIFKMFL
jgi:hypothetical protein